MYFLLTCGAFIYYYFTNIINSLIKLSTVLSIIRLSDYTPLGGLIIKVRNCIKMTILLYYKPSYFLIYLYILKFNKK